MNVSETLDEAYSRLMWLQGRGFPTQPQLDQSLPAEYIKCGVRVGDVGIVSYQGYFDYLFNIFLPADHPLNKDRVPEGFVPLPNIGNVQYHEIEEKTFKSDNAIEIQTKCSLSRGVEQTKYTTIWPHTMGAILILPEGARGEDIQDVDAIRRYTGEHAVAWYRHILLQEVVNGSLHVVTGSDKAPVCIRATMKAALPRSPPTQTLEFKSRMRKDSENRRFYDWVEIIGGGMKLRCGPNPDVIVEEYNQCLFLRSFCVQLSRNEWNNVLGRQRKGIMGLWDSLGLFRRDRVTVTAMCKLHLDAAHPSRMIASYLLKQSRDAKLAIVHHDDWKLLMKEDDKVLPDNDELTGRLKANCDVEMDKDTKAMFLKRRKCSVASS